MSISDDRIKEWGKPIDEKMQVKCTNAIDDVSRVINANFSNIKISTQGSYKNRTNVKIDSDVDIMVRMTNKYCNDKSKLGSAGLVEYNRHYSPSDYTLQDFRNGVYYVLGEKFGFDNVTLEKKCIRIKSTSYRAKVDVVPCFTHHKYIPHFSIETTGIKFVTLDDVQIASFPDIHYDNGVKKNENTKYKYKPVVRVMKNIRNNLIDANKITDKLMPSFLLECLVWNVPDTYFNLEDNLKETVKTVMAIIWKDMRELKHFTYKEVNKIHTLFASSTTKHKEVEDFITKAYSYL